MKIKNYGILHEWVRKQKQKPAHCECCNTNKPYEVANISGKYKRDINDFEWLCRKCHMHNDGRIHNLKKGQELAGNYKKCLFCNKEFYTKPCRIIAKYCSISCSNKNRSISRKTESEVI